MNVQLSADVDGAHHTYMSHITLLDSPACAATPRQAGRVPARQSPSRVQLTHCLSCYVMLILNVAGVKQCFS
jgi:hypothetical protein